MAGFQSAILIMVYLLVSSGKNETYFPLSQTKEFGKYKSSCCFFTFSFSKSLITSRILGVASRCF